jgi:uncharacterized membrane protein YedE/YeeE
MDLTWILETLGENPTVALAGLITGLIFGVAAQRSRFCLRAATVSFARGRLDSRVAVWLLCFSTALVWTQAFDLLGLATLDESRTVANPGSISGALAGGLLFGVGMVLARGCSGRLLVLAATGNLRAPLSGLVFAVIAQMSMDGLLSPARLAISEAWTTQGPNLDLIDYLGLGSMGGLVIGVASAAVALAIARFAGADKRTLWFGSGVGFAVGVGWLLTSTLAMQSSEPVGVESITFSGPSADVLMYTLVPAKALDFDIGLVPGVFIGAAAAALWAREWKLLGFEGAASMRRYLAGAALMGFGAMLAGGCAIGAGVTGASTFALTPWLALCGFWVGAVATDMVVDRPTEAPAPEAGAAPA